MSKRLPAPASHHEPASALCKLERASAECRDTIRLAHEARRDLRTELADLHQFITRELERTVAAQAREAIERLNRDLIRLTDSYATEIQAKFDKLILHLIGIGGQSELDRIADLGDVDQAAMMAALKAAFVDY